MSIVSNGARGSASARVQSLRGDAWRRLRRNKLALAALVYVMVITLATLTADLWVPPVFGDPHVIDTQTMARDRLLPPSIQHPFGTDDLGRDMFGQVVYGARASLTVGVGAVMISLLIGVVLGAIAAHYGRLTDAAIMRVTDAFLVFPVILVYVLVAGLLDMRGVLPVMLALGLFGWPGFARIFRGSVLTVKERDYVHAGRALGVSNKRLMFRHITPNAVSPILVLGTMTIGAAILAESALSYLGIGIQHPAISWGDMISSGRPLMTSAPALVVFPGAAIVGTVLAFTLLGDGIRDALDVKMKA